MANTLLPINERTLTPDQVEALDARRRRGQLCLTICFQMLIVSCLLLLWSGQDATWSPGWMHPMVYLNLLTFGIAAVSGLYGLQLRRGLNEFFSY